MVHTTLHPSYADAPPLAHITPLHTMTPMNTLMQLAYSVLGNENHFASSIVLVISNFGTVYILLVDEIINQKNASRKSPLNNACKQYMLI